MKTRNQGRASLVEFLRSIKFSHEHSEQEAQECTTHFASFKQRVRTSRQHSNEDAQVIRSAN
ncbi:hypothetical protein H2508_14665 [Parahaliea sp. F7430]|uniref:Uncharacterized protein n=1 Tax=Sediminihaliea albiluteola TaxID=2758564 RepID=A0A7W2TYR2_9GAMM|nr:hypothetical protein [Sediminihaliea albiluteola]MBA6414356.1 hypothetical protein [Sediminihaliea albiluteola]